MNSSHLTTCWCDDELDHCHGTLVLHADGVVECAECAEEAFVAARHEWEVACTELGCGCIGDELPLAA